MGLRLDTSQGVNPRGKRGIAVSVLRCKGCGLVYPHPMPVPQSMNDHYDIDPNEYWRNFDFAIPERYFGRQIEAAKALLGSDRAIRAIDIGLGVGKAAKVMRDAGFDVRGIEPSREFYEKALERLGGDEDRFRCLSLEEAQYPSGMFDFVTFGAVLEHLHEPAAALAKAVGWLRPGGLVHAEVPNADHLMSKLLNLWFRLRRTNLVTNLSPMHPPFHIYEFTLEAFRRHGRTSGYEIANHWVDVGSIYHVPLVAKPLLRSLMRTSGTGMQLTVFLRKL